MVTHAIGQLSREKVGKKQETVNNQHHCSRKQPRFDTCQLRRNLDDADMLGDIVLMPAKLPSVVYQIYLS